MKSASSGVLFLLSMAPQASYSADIELVLAYANPEMSAAKPPETRTFTDPKQIDVALIAFNRTSRDRSIDIQGLNTPGHFLIVDETGAKVQPLPPPAVQTGQEQAVIHSGEATVLATANLLNAFQLHPGHTYTVTFPGGDVGINQNTYDDDPAAAKAMADIPKRDLSTIGNSTALRFRLGTEQ